MQPTYPQIPTSTSAGPADIDNPAKNSQFTPTIHRTLYPSVSPTNPNLTQSSQVVIVTGASQGIGRTIALSFAHANAAAIVLVARNTKNLALTAARIHAENKSTKVLTVAADISSQADVSRLEATVRAEFGRADVLVNAAGVWGGRGVISKTPSELWWRDSEIGVKGTYQVTQAFLRLVPEGKRGFVCSLGSGIATMVFPGLSSYSIAKLAIARLTEYVAIENPNVIATVYHPGVVDSDMTEEHADFGYFAKDTAELAGGVAVYLCTERAAYLNGREFNVNWDVDEAEAKKEQILERDLLKFKLAGEFGAKYFEKK